MRRASTGAAVTKHKLLQRRTGAAATKICLKLRLSVFFSFSSEGNNGSEYQRHEERNEILPGFQRRE